MAVINITETPPIEKHYKVHLYMTEKELNALKQLCCYAHRQLADAHDEPEKLRTWLHGHLIKILPE